MDLADRIADRIRKALTTGDFGGAGEAPLSVDQGRPDQRRKRRTKPIALALPAGAPVEKDAADVPDKPGDNNWIDKLGPHGNLPEAIAAMAGDLITERGFTTSHAIATAVSRSKILAAKGNPKYVKAVAEWEKMKASAAVKKASDPDELHDSPALVEDVLHALGIEKPLG